MIEKVKNVAFILILGCITTALLIGIKSFTMPIIKRYEDFMLKASILGAAGVAYERETIDAAFEDTIRTVTKNNMTYYVTPEGLYIFEFIGRGLWGMIQGVITLHPDLETIENIRIISQEETPGLGARITEDEFLNKFKNKKFSPALKLVLRKEKTEISEINAITGATMTSDLLIVMLNDAADLFRSNKRKAEQ